MGIIFFLIGVIFIETSYAGKKKMGDKICIVQMGSIDERIMLYAKVALEGIFNKKIDIFILTHDLEYAYHKRRKQYYSTKFLKKLRALELVDYGRVLGIIDVDLYVPELTFVFGEADLKNRVSIISLTRLRQEFYNLPKDLTLFNQRVITEAVHELGHTYGLRHCGNDNCVLFFSKTLADTDKKGSDFCRNCKKMLQHKQQLGE
ncbi:MAG: peptidase [Candidatus Scalindua sp.]|nr:archaemetzincin family Zn-dependent metalloprotease [Planctomycetota bacterium]GJQ58527.1 MAG: peptidase [Candidatus Scalindua sp.]